jgi:hypothetical protein
MSPDPRRVATGHRYRRRLLYCLLLYTNPMGLGDVAHQLAVWESRDGADGQAFVRARLRVDDALREKHLPPLREAGLVAYDPAADTVELGPAAGRIEPALTGRLPSELSDLLRAERAAPGAGP